MEINIISINKKVKQRKRQLTAAQIGSLGGRTNVEKNGTEALSRAGIRGGNKMAQRGPDYFRELNRKSHEAKAAKKRAAQERMA